MPTPAHARAHEPNPAEELLDHVVPDAAKPHLRGWLHAGMAPLAVVAGIVLVMLAPTGRTTLASAIFATTSVILFTTSALYHRWRGGEGTRAVLKRMDHANIFLLIAGTYTPLALLLPRPQALVLLGVVWTGAVLGVAFRILWHGAPRWLYVLLYIALGWVAAFFMLPLLRAGGPWLVGLIVLGGVLYTAGAVCYGLKRPNPFPTWFGFHEIFHTATVLAFLAHYTAISLAVYGATPRGVI